MLSVLMRKTVVMLALAQTLKRLMAHKGVQTAVIVNTDGIPIRTMPANMEHKDAVMFPGVLMPVIQKARQMVKALDSQNEFSAMRLRSTGATPSSARSRRARAAPLRPRA